MNKLDCKIIQDLLVNYVENLTSKETNEYIENHLRECKECKKTVEIMQKSVIAEENKSKNQIDYLKKYKRKMLALKLIVSSIIVVLLIFLGIKIYQWQFITKIYEKNVDFDAGNNYKLITRDGSSGATNEMIYKDGVSCVKLNDRGTIWENETNKYMIIEENKQYMELDKNAPPVALDNTITFSTYALFNVNTKAELLGLVFKHGINIHKEEYGETQCYVILFEGEKVWVNIDTLQIIRSDYEGQTTEYFLETNNVTAKDIQLPNLNEYSKLK